MSDVAFERAFDALAVRLGRSIQVPRSATWHVADGPTPVIVATMPADALTQNIQTDDAAVPSFAFCLAWWFERFELFGPRSVRARVEITGDIPPSAHTNRSLFLLHELENLLGDRFTCSPAVHVPWPRQPLVNDRVDPAEASVVWDGTGSERDLECAFTTQPQVVEQFAAIDRITGIRRQFPLGIFDGRISSKTRWSPGGKSQIDLWASAVDGDTVHLFELKKDGNLKVGMLPEALWYARLLHRIRVDDFGGMRVEGGGANMDIVRSAKRLSMWLLAPSVHPLLLHDGRSPLEWLHGGLAASGLDFGILPFRAGACLQLLPDDRWPLAS